MAALAICGCCLPLSVAFAGAIDSYDYGHGDIWIDYDAGQDLWSFLFRCEDCTLNGVTQPGESFFPSTQVEAQVPPSTLTTAQQGPFIDDTTTGAAAGEQYYKLPEAAAEANAEQAPWLGLNREGIANGVFVDNDVVMSLESVTFQGVGGGDFSYFSSDAGLGFPIPHFWMSSFDAAATQNGDNTIEIGVGGGAHAHFNMGFTDPGLYEVTFRVEGDLVAGGSTSGTGTYLFRVDPVSVPGPGFLLVPALGLATAWLLRSRSRLERA